MSATCRIGDVEAVRADDRWSCDDAEMLAVLNRLSVSGRDEWHGPEHGDPDYACAAYCMTQLGGEIVRWDEPPPDGVVY